MSFSRESLPMCGGDDRVYHVKLLHRHPYAAAGLFDCVSRVTPAKAFANYSLPTYYRFARYRVNFTPNVRTFDGANMLSWLRFITWSTSKSSSERVVGTQI